jgi:hypothetical protein
MRRVADAGVGRQLVSLKMDTVETAGVCVVASPRGRPTGSRHAMILVSPLTYR